MKARLVLPAMLAFVLVLAGAPAARACHFGGLGCGNPESQPFNPQVSMTLADNRAGAHSSSTLKITQQNHEQFLVRIVADFAKEASADLDKPAFGEKIADLSVKANISGASTTLTGRIKDNNDPSTGFPAGGVFDWLVEIDPTAPGMDPTFFHIAADRNAADAHLHFDFKAPQSLIDQAQTVDASVQEISTSFFGNVAAGAFLTNPTQAGTFNSSFALSARDANGDGSFSQVTRVVAVKVIGPTSVTMSPTSATHRTGESHTQTATVKDQDGNTMSGVSVVFARTGANPGSATMTTGSNGQATHTYTGTNAGDDTITATATLSEQQASGTATVSWYVPAATNMTLQPGSQTRTTGSAASMTANVTDQQGRALAGVSVHFAVAGANSISGDKTTDASGAASFSYSGSNAGSDTVTASAGNVSAQASVTWQVPSQCNTNTDYDCDGLVNTQDNCWNVANPDQRDSDGDHIGDACDNDDDNDSLLDTEEAPNACNQFVADTDADGLNDWQEVKGYHTSCSNPDTDGDGLKDGAEIQRGTSPTNPDSDGDGVKDGADNCPTVKNADQRDTDGDGKGDLCDGIEIRIP